MIGTYNQKKYDEQGYIIDKNIIDSESILKVNKLIDNLNPKTFIPYSKFVPWGYGNLINNNDLKNIIKFDEISNYVTKYLVNGNAICNHLLITNKPAFIGPDVEWHQEFANINSYAPGYVPNESLDNFLQVYVALDDHTIENGTLFIFEGSHKEGLMEYEDIINNHLNHKRRLTYDSLQKISNKYKLKPLIIKAGTAATFNHLVVHGSPTNCSSFRRRALLMQFRISIKDKDNEIFNEETKYRTHFVMNECQKRANKLKETNPYIDWNKSKTIN